MQHLRGSKTFMTKTELIDTAEASGLSAKPIKGGSVTSYHGGPPTGIPLHVVPVPADANTQDLVLQLAAWI